MNLAFRADVDLSEFTVLGDVHRDPAVGTRTPRSISQTERGFAFVYRKQCARSMRALGREVKLNDQLRTTYGTYTRSSYKRRIRIAVYFSRRAVMVS